MTKSVDDMTLPELRAYAKNELGLSVPQSATEKILREAIREVSGDKADEQSKPGTVNIIIHKQPGKGGDRDVPVVVHGKIYLLQRGKKIPCPMPVYNVLKDAIETRASVTKNERGETIMEMYEAQSYPFSVVE